MKCYICEGKAYITVTRCDGRKAIERCDNCAFSCLSDEQASVLARHDGIKCAEGYPCYLKEDES